MKFRDYIIKRLLLLIPVIIGVSIMSFVLAFYIGDPLAPYISAGNNRVGLINFTQLRILHGLAYPDGTPKPWYVLYFEYINRLIHGDWGTTGVTSGSKPVLGELLQRFPATVELAVIAMFFAIIIGLPVGIISAIKKDKWEDQTSRFLALTGVSMPVFWLGLMLQLVIVNVNISFNQNFPINFRYNVNKYPSYPISSIYGLPPTHFLLVDSLVTLNFSVFIDALLHIITPAFVLSWVSMAILARMTRMSMLETMKQDFILLAKSKGLKERVIIYRHALRNALIPTLTIAGLALAGLMTGAVLTETVFAWPGIGKFAADASETLDLPSIQGFVILSALIYVFSNLLVDLLYAYIDPRIRFD